MKKHSLNGRWEFCQQGASDWLPATVPGSVHLDLMEAGLIPDPFFGANEDAVQWVITKKWQYQLTFSPDPEILRQEQVILRFDGIDTIAEIHLNGHHLGSTDNMFRSYEYNVKDCINPSENKLVVKFASLTETIDHIHEEKQIPDTSPMGIEGGQYLRKAPCQFGWDWGPALPPIGIWKDVSLIGVSHPRINDVNLRQHHSDEVSISALVTLDSDPIDSMKIEMCITTPDGSQIVSTSPAAAQNTIKTVIENPQLWFPNGYGQQPLYQVTVQLKNEETILDSKQYQIGLRTIELLQRSDEWGKSFTFVVNGISIFAKGSNWIPADSFPTRISRTRMEQWIRDAAVTHHNMLRVWGGGLYESEDFYDLCDQYGILVWQDFLFACKIYPFTDKAYIENVHQEVIENVTRLRHRASLALWCGNNEMEWGWEVWRWDKPENAHLKSAYDIFFHHLLPEWLEELDPDTQYWPSSPSSDLPFTDVNGQSAGDAHYWDVWHGGKPFTSYRDQFPRFMSEFGFQAFPALETIQQYTEKKDQNLTSYVMELHQKNKAGNRLIINQMTEWYKIPTTFDKLMYASHILQAEGIRYGVEHWRRFNARVSGILYWQLNDCWPVASWASVDYFGRWKALHYAAKKFYAPVLLSIFDVDQHMGIWLTNDNLEDFSGEIKWQLASVTGEIKESGKEDVCISAQASREVFVLDFELSEEQKPNMVFIAELWSGEQLLTTQVVTFVPDKHVNYVDPELSASVTIHDHTVEISLTAKNLARFVEVKFNGLDTVFSDNYFDIPAGSSRTVICTIPEGGSLEDIKQKLALMHLYESYQG